MLFIRHKKILLGRNLLYIPEHGGVEKSVCWSLSQKYLIFHNMVQQYNVKCGKNDAWVTNSHGERILKSVGIW